MRVLLALIAVAVLVGCLVGCPKQEEADEGTPPIVSRAKTTPPPADETPDDPEATECAGDCDPETCEACAAKAADATECAGDCDPETCEACAAKAAGEGAMECAGGCDPETCEACAAKAASEGEGEDVAACDGTCDPEECEACAAKAEGIDEVAGPADAAPAPASDETLECEGGVCSIEDGLGDLLDPGTGDEDEA